MKMHSNQKLSLAPLLLTALICSGVSYALGYTGVYSNLEQTRSSLLDQRDHLQRLQSNYQQQLSLVNGYLSDNDRALRDVEEAMRTAR